MYEKSISAKEFYDKVDKKSSLVVKHKGRFYTRKELHLNLYSSITPLITHNKLEFRDGGLAWELDGDTLLQVYDEGEAEYNEYWEKV